MGRRLTKWSGGDRCHSGGFLLRIMPPSWQPVPACTRNGHSAGGQFFLAATIKLQAGHSPCDHNKATGGQFYFAAKKNRIGRGIVAATTAAGGTAILCDKENWNRTRHRCDNDCAGELFYLTERWHCSDSRFQAQTWQSLQPWGTFRPLPCSDS